MTDKEAMFISEYMVDFDAKNAAIRAGYAPSTANDASKWIHPEHPEKPKLRKEIDIRIAAAARRTGITRERIMAELAKVAFANISDVVDPQTGMLNAEALKEDSAAIKSYKAKTSDKGDEYSVDMGDKVRALELIGKTLGMFRDEVAITGAVPTIIDDIGNDKDQ